MNKTKSRKKTSHKKTFSKKDYSSGDGMLTTIWGPNMWHYLHTVSFMQLPNCVGLERQQHKEKQHGTSTKKS